MANPPFNQDITDPADNAVVSQFPANERTFRDNVNSYLNTEHDINTGYHKFQVLTSAQITALTSPPAGMEVYNSTIGAKQINIGTSVAPIWSTVGFQIGDVKKWVTTTAPSGWLLCDGSAVSRTTYANLYAIIGTAFGAGDGSTTFNLPDHRGRIAAGYDSGNAAARLTASNAGFTAGTIGNAGGDERLENHTHGLSDPGHIHGVSDPGHVHQVQQTASPSAGGSNTNNLVGNNNNANQLATTSSTTGISITASGTGISVAAAGAGGSANVQPTIVFNYVIKYQ